MESLKNEKKMYKTIFKIFLLIFPFGLFAQNDIKTILIEIEQNNTTLSAYKNLNEAQKLENNTNIFLENPEVGFNYLWGDPSAIGNRQDFSVSQSFDFPTHVHHLSRYSGRHSSFRDGDGPFQKSSSCLQ